MTVPERDRQQVGRLQDQGALLAQRVPDEPDDGQPHQQRHPVEPANSRYSRRSPVRARWANDQ